MQNAIVKDIDKYHFQCPHCGEYVQVLVGEIRCTIFRHGVFKHSGEQMNPHTPKYQCDLAYEQGAIYGCGRPFIFDGNHVMICGYI